MISSDYTIELNKFSSGYKWVIGVDEVGRGPLAGPVVAAAVAWQIEDIKFAKLIDIQDSKKINEKNRLASAKFIKSNFIHSISQVSVKNIEKLNILEATMLAMRRSILSIVNKIGPSVHVLIDGNKTIPQLTFDQSALITGDSNSKVIGAASIIAKVYRDNIMLNLAKSYPQYGFEQNKGYGTKKHIESIKKYGLSSVHRPSFCSKIINEVQS